MEYTDIRAAHASRPAVVWREPMRTRSGAKRSAMAVPSARNSAEASESGFEVPPVLPNHVPGLERMSKWQPGLEFASRMVRMDLD